MPEDPPSIGEMNLRLRLAGWQVAGARVESADGPGRYVVVISRGAELIRVEGDGAVTAWSEAYRRAGCPGPGRGAGPQADGPERR